MSDIGGTIRNSSSRIFETLQAETRKTKHNGKSVHKTFTDRQNLRQCIAHMAMGEEWAAVEVEDGAVLGTRQVRAGDALRDLLEYAQVHEECRFSHQCSWSQGILATFCPGC
jgi:hypothetical protein